MAASKQNVGFLKKLLAKDGPAELLFRDLVAKYGAPYLGEVGRCDDLHNAIWKLVGEQERLYQMMRLNYAKLQFPGVIGIHRAPDHHRVGFWLSEPGGKESFTPILDFIVGCRWRGNEYHAGLYVMFQSDDRIPVGGYLKEATPVINDIFVKMTNIRDADDRRAVTAEEVGLACQVR